MILKKVDRHAYIKEGRMEVKFCYKSQFIRLLNASTQNYSILAKKVQQLCNSEHYLCNDYDN